ncbi:Thioredoxin domain-containing protein 3 [Mycena sanguinolenta]|uniref:Nucleoside diphosphate kinase n=1 Tax=Mycena sanguinolenta TaxID=230812 RepID=A0A8H6XU45_9AGAR|nr:Thioredoxin domain-containing protein 3 [Mycena sanguinolenta]
MSDSPSSNSVTRTVAIIKHHALSHRFDIERRIQEASFEIVKERQMEFDVESDPETLYELFGEDADSLGEGPVWVYVLERRRAVEVLLTLMGDRDPNVARGIPELFARANGIMGSPDTPTAEMQIASLFASSPPFPTSDLPDADGRYASMRSVSSSVLDALRQTTSDEGYAPSNPSTTGQGRLSNGKPLFKARPLPTTHAAPDIVPRMTKAAALRAGIAVVAGGPSVPREPLSKEALAKTFANVPGHKRAESIAVASTAAPTIAPRMTRATALRLGLPPPAPVRRQASDSSDRQTFDGVPGHKRRESIAVASVAAPTVAPRLNKSAALRANKDAAPPSSFQFRPPTTPKLPGLSRSNSTSSLGQYSTKPPSRPASAAGGAPKPAPAPTRARPSSVSVRPAAPRASILPNAKPASTVPSSAAAAENDVVKAKPRPSSINTPSIAPRTNRSAALRAAKQEAENAAAAKAAARKAGGRPSARPAPAIATF